MEISIPLNNVNSQYIYFGEKKKNVIVSGDFIKLIYSTSGFEMNGLYIIFELQNAQQNVFKLQNTLSFRSDMNEKSSTFELNHTNSLGEQNEMSSRRLLAKSNVKSSSPSNYAFSTRNGIKTSTSLRSLSDIDENVYTKKTIIFDPYLEHNYRIIQKLWKIEQDIIERYTTGKYIPKFASYILKNQLLGGSLKCYSECKDMLSKHYNTEISKSNEYNNYERIILKISGIWETDTNIGITIKFMILQNEISY